MSVPKKLGELVGNWSGINRLWLSWHEDKTPKESDSTVTIEFAAKRKFININYTWIYEDETQEGQILLGHEKESDKIKAVWIDSFHMSDKFMINAGNVENDVISIKGFYSVPENPDWGWRTVIDFADDKTFKIVMYNVTPEGEEEIAVEAIYTRKTQTPFDRSLNAVTK
jgi:Protein of unknown function (DUF1579)